MRILVLATAAFAVPSLEALVAHGHQMVCCLTQPPRPQGRGLAPLPSPVKTAATRLGLPVEEPDDLGAHLADVQSRHPDLGVVISYGRLIPASYLRTPRHGMLGVHPSLLPKYRGASPMVWAMLNGESETGVTIFRLNERLDAGDIQLSRTASIGPRETAEQLSKRLAHLGAELLVDAVQQLERGSAVFTPQDERQATDAPKLTKVQGRIDWQHGAESIDRRIRAMRPWPGTYTDWRGEPMKIWSAEVGAESVPPGARPGEVVAVSPEALAVATGHGILMIEELQLAGRRYMRVRDFLAGHPITVGERLGSEE